MRIYFLRHGRSLSRALWSGDDRLRPLTRGGVEALEQAAEAWRRLDPPPELIVTSPLVRARQTAEVAAEALGMAGQLIEDERLAPGFESAQLVSLIDDHPAVETLMVVGHEPDFSATVAKLIGGGRLQVKKGGLATIEIAERVGDMIFGVLISLLTPAQTRGE